MRIDSMNHNNNTHNADCDIFKKYINTITLFAVDGDDAQTFFAAFRAKQASYVIRMRFAAHTLVCKVCAQKKRRLTAAEQVLKTGFLPPPPEPCADAVMAFILAGEGDALKEVHEYVSLRGWIIAGIVIVASLLSVYLNVDFGSIARTQGLSFLLPLGITIGAVITAYSAMFIGTHLDMLCEKLGLNLK